METQNGINTVQHTQGKLYYYTGTLLVAFALVLLVTISTVELLYGHAPVLYNSFIILFSAACFGGSFLITRHMLKKQKQAQLNYYLVAILRFVTSTVMLFYSFTKLYNGHMYQSYYALDSRLNDLNDFDTVWSFYGRYSSFQTLIGLLELLPSLLLLFRRTAFIGAVIMLPVVANVVVLNIFYKIGGFTLPVSFLVMVFSSYILYSYKDLVLEFFKRLKTESRRPVTLRPFTKRLFTVIKIFPIGMLVLLILLKGLVNKGQRSTLKGAYELVEFKNNQQPVSLDSLPADAYRKIYFEKRRIQNSVSTNDGPQGASIVFHKKDSLKITFRRGPLDMYVAEDTTGAFKGTYRIVNDSMLVLKGRQRAMLIEARYKKLPLREFDYWWE